MSAPLVPDALWKAIEPLLRKESPKPRGGRPRVSDRAALAGIVFVPPTGCRWRLLPKELGCGSGTTCWRRLRDWHPAGVWEKLHARLLNWLGDELAVDWSRVSVDSLSVRSRKRGEQTGPKPVDRGKPGSKYHLVVDRNGIPFVQQFSSRQYLAQSSELLPARPRARPRLPAASSIRCGGPMWVARSRRRSIDRGECGQRGDRVAQADADAAGRSWRGGKHGPSRRRDEAGAGSRGKQIPATVVGDADLGRRDHRNAPPGFGSEQAGD